MPRSYSGMLCYQHTTIIAVRPSVMEGQRKRFDPETPVGVSQAVEGRKLELGDLSEWQSWH